MIADITTLILSLIGIIAMLYSFIFRITSSLTEDMMIVIPLNNDDENIHSRISYLISLLDFCHIKKKCTIVVKNYGASESYCNELREYYSAYKNIRIDDIIM